MLCPTPHLTQAVSTKEKESHCMSAIQNLHSFDPFADASKGMTCFLLALRIISI
jgi:hypothetical protein